MTGGDGGDKIDHQKCEAYALSRLKTLDDLMRPSIINDLSTCDLRPNIGPKWSKGKLYKNY